jgi:hypothetical protein
MNLKPACPLQTEWMINGLVRSRYILLGEILISLALLDLRLNMPFRTIELFWKERPGKTA